MALQCGQPTGPGLQHSVGALQLAACLCCRPSPSARHGALEVQLGGTVGEGVGGNRAGATVGEVYFENNCRTDLILFRRQWKATNCLHIRRNGLAHRCGRLGCQSEEFMFPPVASKDRADTPVYKASCSEGIVTNVQ